MLESSRAFHQELLRSESKRIVGVISFILLFAILASVRIFVMGYAMSRLSLLAAGLMIGFEFVLLGAVNRVLQFDESISRIIWSSSTALESLFPALGIAFLLADEHTRK